MIAPPRFCRVSVVCSVVAQLMVSSLFGVQQPSAADRASAGRIAFLEGRYREAESELRESLRLFKTREHDASFEIALVQGDLAWLLVATTGGFPEAEELLNQSLRLLGAQDSHNCKYAIGIRSHLGILYQKTGRPERAASTFQKALKDAHRCADAQIEIILNNLAILYGETGKLKQASKMLHESVALIEKQPKTEATDLILAQALTTLAAVQQVQGELAPAEENFRRVIPILDALVEHTGAALPKRFLSVAWEQFGLLRYQEHRLDEAERAIARSQALEQLQPTTDMSRNAKLWSELGDILAAANRYDDAKLAFKQALDSSPDRSQQAVILEHFSRLLRLMKADSEADDAAFRAKALRAAAAYTTRLK